MEKSWKEAIKRVLSEAAEPLHYTEICEQILARGYYESDGATPANTVKAVLSTSIKEGAFVRVNRGYFALNPAMASPAPAPASPKSKPKTVAVATVSEADVEASESIIYAFGMYWQRDLVVWRNDPKMYGKQQAQAKAVDFGKQKGIYILYDHHTVVYVGRSIDRPLGKRLYEHTVDRLGSRWNRFSWFGLLDVTEEGDLEAKEMPLNTSLASLIATLEALLIETLEPPQNRKRGDDFSAIEYIQDIDPELKEREIQQTLRSIEQKLRGGS